MKYTLHIEADCDTENPCEWSGWEFVSFNRNHTAFQHPCNFVEVGPRGQTFPVNIGIRRKMTTGTAFVLSCYEHSGVQWGLQGEVWQCPWDTAPVAGILLWKDSAKDLPKGFAERQKCARSFLEEYTSWCNGDCYSYTLEDEDGEWIDGCGGVIGHDAMTETIKEVIKDYPGEYEFEGDSAWIAERL